ncbi:MAG TPA: DUF6475 domain-containing protein [Gammaproteobacteria bacterium]|nr:DUF6475 domain-containing protein [Gammaproteobacteria bacterium]
MEPTDAPEFASLLQTTLEVYDRACGPMVVELWWRALARYPIQAVRAAFSAHIQDPGRGTFPPKPADILRRLQRGTPEERALLAWSAVERAIRQVGPYSSVVFEDPVTQHVVHHLGGWIHLCATPSERDLEFQGKEFAARYATLVSHPPSEPPPPLPGLLERDQLAHGGPPGRHPVCRIARTGIPKILKDPPPPPLSASETDGGLSQGRGQESTDGVAALEIAS